MERSNISKILLEKENKRLADENYMFQLTIKHNALRIEQQQETITMMSDIIKNVTSDVAHINNDNTIKNNALLIEQQQEAITTLLNENKNLTSEVENYKELFQDTPQ